MSNDKTALQRALGDKKTAIEFVHSIRNLDREESDAFELRFEVDEEDLEPIEWEALELVPGEDLDDV